MPARSFLQMTDYSHGADVHINEQGKFLSTAENHRSSVLNEIEDFII